MANAKTSLKQSLPGNGRGLGNGLGVFLLVLLLVLFLVNLGGREKGVREVFLTEALNLVEQNKVERVSVEGENLEFVLGDGAVVASRKEAGISFWQILEQAGIAKDKIPGGIQVKDPTVGSNLFNLLINILPIILIGFIFFSMMRQARQAGDNIFAFGRSRAKLFTRDLPQVRFADVAGADEAKRELYEVVDFLKNPGKYRALGAHTPKGVLLVGPSGVGKTLMARAVAGEAGVPFFSVAGSEFMEFLVGVGASRVRDLFEMAKKSAPSIIFIDEIDAIGRQRGFGVGGGHDEREQTLNQILVEMDGFAPTISVIVVAATNRPDLLDPALVRPGRFDRRVILDLPNIEERKGILKIHMRGKPFGGEVDVEKLARRTVGFSGADIENMLNEAAILAARVGRDKIDVVDLEEAATKVKLGPEKKRIQSEEERKMTAYHEAGHAIVAAFLPHHDPVYRISIVSRGLALGFTLIPPSIDRYQETKTRLEEILSSLLGGRAAEELVFNEQTVGAASDLEQATRIARKMVVDFGMSRLGPVSLEARVDDGTWSNFWRENAPSDATAAKIDAEVKRLLDQAYKRAKKILKEQREKLDRVAIELVNKETIEGDEFAKLIGRETLLPKV